MDDHLKDKYFKEMVERHLKEFLGLLQPEQKYKIIATDLNKELIVRRRKMDFVAKVRVRRRVFLFHFEFISQYRRRLVRKAYGYGGVLTLKYNCDVVTALFVLKPPSKKAQRLGYYDIAPFGSPLNEHNLAVVELWKLREAILAGEKEYLALMPLLPELSLKVDMGLLHRQRELIALVDNPALKAELKFYTMVFLQDYFSQKFLSKFFSEDQKMLEHWERVPIFGERIKQRSQEAWDKGLKLGEERGLEQGREKGREEGREEGMALAMQENILGVLNSRFGVANGNIVRVISAIDKPKKLRVIFQRVVNAESLDDVKKILVTKKHSAKKRARSGSKQKTK